MAVVFYFARHGETLFNVQNRVQGWCDSPLTSAGIYDAYRMGLGLAEVELAGACTSDSGRAQHTLSIALEARQNERERKSRGLPVPADQIKVDEADDLFASGEIPRFDQVAAIEEFLRSRGCLRPCSTVPDTDSSPEVDRRLLALAEGWAPSLDELEWVDYPAFALSPRSVGTFSSPPVPVRRDTRLREWCFGDLEGEVARRLRNRLFDLFGDDLSREEQNERLNEIADHIALTDPTRRAENFAAIALRLTSFLNDCGRSVEARGGGNVLVVSHALLIRTLVFLYARERVSEPPKIKNASITKVVWDEGTIHIESVGDTSYLEYRG